MQEQLAGSVAAEPASEEVRAEFWVDPLCCWSWAIEPELRRLRERLGAALAWRYRLGGMIEAWQRYSDPLNSVSMPSQMGPLWLHARRVTGAALNDRVWVDDPPASSYPASLAVKAAELQSREHGETFLRDVWKALMVEGKNVSSRKILVSIAEELEQAACGGSVAFCAARFVEDLSGEEAVASFRRDLQEAAYRRIGRFPAIVLRRPASSRGLILFGFRRYPELLRAVEALRQER